MFLSNSCKIGHIPNNPITVETYRPHDQSKIISIDEALDELHFFCIETFNFKVGDCLFDTIHFLLHGQYTPNELRNGLVDNFHAKH